MPTRSEFRSNHIDPDIESSSRGLTPYSMVLIGFSMLCFLGAFYMSLGAGAVQSFTFNPGEEKQIEQLNVKEPNTVFLVDVSQSTSGLTNNKGWSDVSVNVGSPEGSNLMAFGSDFWRASGYDDGPWSEKKNSFDMKVTFPIVGKYPVSIESASSPPNYNKPVLVRFEPKRGSTIPFFVFGVVALLVGIVMGYYANREAVNTAIANSIE
ncbi:hypothetical protein [Puniceicoccus vermicola]|uniref:Uncharacterized protein n=1 Tax=Puniceicoccus vermicola TaxID=388746 RepID=A0A7X1B0M9_9BACT|nr:hypothetical protein [Puniceicoccus vermicola]MBC2603372.1 hypothetical protein [Puniceicoccus vermicola]